MKNWIERHIFKIFVAPAIFFILFMVALPLVYTIYLGFTDWRMGAQTPNIVGLDNYVSIVQDKIFWQAVFKTVYFAFFTVALEAVIALMVATWFNREFKGKNIVKTIFLLPMVATPIAVGMVWVLIYEPTIGVANYLLRLIGLDPVMWLVNPSIALNSIVGISTWKSMPMVALIVMAGYAGLPTDPFESAVVDGASKIQIFTKITLPLISPTLIIAVLLRLIDALKEFDLIYALTEGGPLRATETLNILAYKTVFQYLQMGKGGAMIVLFLGVIGICCGLVIRIRAKVGVDF